MQAQQANSGGTVDLATALDWQEQLAARNGAPATARVIRAMRLLPGAGLAVGRRMADWPALSLEHALPLRLCGGLHYLHLVGAEDRLGPVYAGALEDQAAVDAVVLAVARDHDAALLVWLDGPPQTNEAGRSAAIMAGLAWLAARWGTRFELAEIGASAGANTMIERYRYDLGGVMIGPRESPVRIAPQWRGPPPPTAPVAISAIAGCDRAPIALADAEQAMRLRAYVWPEMAARAERLEAIIALARARPPQLEQADAADWVERRLAMPQEAGVCRVLYHSIVWQYLPGESRARIGAAMQAAGEQATADRPLAWLAVEMNRESFTHELVARVWPGGEGAGGGEPVLLARAQAHGAWVEWLGA